LVPWLFLPILLETLHGVVGAGAGAGAGVGVGDDDAQHKFMVIGECVAYVVPEFPAKE
jgi:hypothetical protein